MTRNVVITGVGTLLPEVNSLEQLYNIHSLDKEISIKKNGDIVATVINTEIISQYIAPRLAKKLDEFTCYALIAAQFALDDAQLNLDTIDKKRCGVFVGNSFGGWRFTERELYKLHIEGPRAVSPFQATSWFPAAPQGQITIKYGIKGFSKTFMADRSSSLHSVSAAADQIKNGRLDFAIAGGCESINCPFVVAALSKLISNSFLIKKSKFPISEGAVFFILETEETAKASGRKIYARLGNLAISNLPCESNLYGTRAQPYERAMSLALTNIKPDVILTDAISLPDVNKAELDAVRKVCGDVAISTPKLKFGHSFGTEGALDIAYACLMLNKQKNFLKKNDINQSINNVLINSSAVGGSVSSLLLSNL